MDGNVVSFPKWKKDAPVHERLYEIAEMARANPTMFSKWVLFAASDDGKGLHARYFIGDNTRTHEAVGLIHIVEPVIIEDGMIEDGMRPK